MKKFIIHYILTAQLVPVLLMKQQLFLWRKTAVLRENLNIISTIELSWSNILKEYLSYAQKNLSRMQKTPVLGLLSSCASDWIPKEICRVCAILHTCWWKQENASSRVRC